MSFFKQWSFPAQKVSSLNWQGDTLIDWVQGGKIYDLDGKTHRIVVNYAYRFNAAKISPSGKFAVIYERNGTKGLILNYEQRIVREINRSFYYGHVYDYPVTLFQLPNGREVIAHCPEHYCQIEIEDTFSGERLTAKADRKPIDIFYSRLAVHNTGQYLLSASWVWSPWDAVTVWDISTTLANPSLPDGYGIAPRTAAEVSSAAFRLDHSIILTTSDDSIEDIEDEGNPDPLLPAGPRSIAVFDLTEQRFLSIVKSEETIGEIMPVGSRHCINFYEHPKLVDLSSGHIIHRWPELKTSKQISSITWGRIEIPPLALDPSHYRFAIASETEISIVTIDPDELP